MNILLIAEDLLLNGVTRHIIDLANGLTEKNHHVFVAGTPSDQIYRLGKGVSFVSLNLCYPGDAQKRYYGLIPSVLNLFKLVRDNDIQLIHTHKRYADVIGRFIARRTKTKHVSTCHNEFDNYLWLSPFGDIIIAPSPEIAHMLIHRFKKNEQQIRTIYYGIKPLTVHNDDLKGQYRKLYGIEDDKKIILSVGHLNKQKDRRTLIDALHILQRNGKLENALCIIVGEGKETPVIKDLIHTYKLEQKIMLLPASSNIEALNNIAEFCVLSSIHEAAPHTILEAASIRKPHVATAVGFIPGFIGPNLAGICVLPKNPDQLADGIQYLLSNPERIEALGAEAEKRFQKFHLYESFIDRTLDLYSETLQVNR